MRYVHLLQIIIHVFKYARQTSKHAAGNFLRNIMEYALSKILVAS
jgi:hypothetical protein